MTISYRRSLLAVFAHPDDETFRPGGTLAFLAQQGVRVHVLTATRGEAGSPGGLAIYTAEELPKIRSQELSCACAALRIEPPRWMDYQDGQVDRANPDTITSEILTVVQATRPGIILSFGPDGVSGHPDHVAIGRYALEAYQRAREVAALYTVAMPVSVAGKLGIEQIRPVPDEAVSLSIIVLPVWDLKLAAMRCHATQRHSTPLLNASEEKQKCFFGREFFVRAACRHPDRDYLPEILKELYL